MGTSFGEKPCVVCETPPAQVSRCHHLDIGTSTGIPDLTHMEHVINCWRRILPVDKPA